MLSLLLIDTAHNVTCFLCCVTSRSSCEVPLLTLMTLFQFIDSDDDNDGYVDTDEEVSNGRMNLLNGSGPPYFHGYLYMKSE